ncbi:hypothetical protein I4F81_009171 [Pyropia yezoensis]|uniref:Uncharacterized protein n=1 Tax=Pyropia yezoensis TaxID=2788 RepID=A0ACC3C8U9_PYRYE|nr:hypothetical protein I4F81_009171 [Neopyropia yezoensis]
MAVTAVEQAVYRVLEEHGMAARNSKRPSVSAVPLVPVVGDTDEWRKLRAKLVVYKEENGDMRVADMTGPLSTRVHNMRLQRGLGDPAEEQWLIDQGFEWEADRARRAERGLHRRQWPLVKAMIAWLESHEGDLPLRLPRALRLPQGPSRQSGQHAEREAMTAGDRLRKRWVHSIRIYGGASRLSFLHSFLHEAHLARIRRYRLAKLTFDTALAVAPGGAEPHRLAQSGLDNPLDAPGTMRLRYAAAEAWMTLHRDFVTKAVTGDLSRQLLALLAPTLVPEEHFFAMLAANHLALWARTAKDAMRGIVWTHQGVPSEGARPYYVDSRDLDSWEYLLADRVLGTSAMFVRKMQDVDDPLMDRIDSESPGVAGAGSGRADNASAAAAKAVRLNERLTCHLRWQAAGQPQGPVASRRPCEHLR